MFDAIRDSGHRMRESAACKRLGARGGLNAPGLSESEAASAEHHHAADGRSGREGHGERSGGRESVRRRRWRMHGICLCGMARRRMSRVL